MSHIVTTKGVWLDYTDIGGSEHTMHVVEWLNGDGCDVSLNGTIIASLHSNELQMLATGAYCLGLVDLTEVKQEAEAIFNNTKQREEDMKRIKEKFA